MVNVLSAILEEDQANLRNEFKAIHQSYGSSEVPFAALRLPSAQRRFPQLDRTELATALAPAFAAFSSTRRQQLRLYDGVENTLRIMTDGGVTVVGHTEAVAINAYYRVVVLEIDRFMRRLYTLEGKTDEHPHGDRPRKLAPPPPDFLRELPISDRKPNPTALLDICRREGFEPSEACYVGDSIVRDIAMAKTAGVTAVWARYGTKYESSNWDTLVSVTHWTDADVAREIELRKQYGRVSPDAIIDSFDQILAMPGLAHLQRAG